jgi:hypothetical protein
MDIPQPKFKIGDIVYLKHMGAEQTRLFILEIHIQICCGGAQIHYMGGLYTNGLSGGISSKRHAIHPNKWTLREDELGDKIPEQQTQEK